MGLMSRSNKLTLACMVIPNLISKFGMEILENQEVCKNVKSLNYLRYEAQSFF